MGQKALVGLRDGTIYETELGNGNKRVIMESHSEGEVWGLAVNGDTVLTTGDDNKIKQWNLTSRKCEATGTVSNDSRKAPRGGASTLSELPASQ